MSTLKEKRREKKEKLQQKLKAESEERKKKLEKEQEQLREKVRNECMMHQKAAQESKEDIAQKTQQMLENAENSRNAISSGIEKKTDSFFEKSADRIVTNTEKNLKKQTRAQMGIYALPIYISTVCFCLFILFRTGSEIDTVVTLRVLILSIPLTAIFTFLFYGMARYNRNQIVKLSDALEEAANGNLDFRLDTTKKGTMTKAYEDYNNMCARLKAYQAEMLEAVDEANRANQAKSSFLSNMSHEIRTPINAVLGMDEMIIRESREEQIRDYAMDIRNAGKTLLSLINDILDFSKIESGKMEIIPVEYDLSSIINDLLNMTESKAKDKGLTLEVNVNKEMPHLLYGDEVRIKQVALNVLNNAVKYTDKGKVTLSVDYEKRAGEKAIDLLVRVVDTGKGIKEEDLGKLFSPFERIEEKRNRSIEGTGLGMSITKNLLAMMDSHLDVSSVYGEGSDFSFRVRQEIRDEEPIGDFAERYKLLQAKEAKYQESFHAPDAQILVIDDVEMNLTVIKNLLKQTKVQIETGGSGKVCLEKASQKKYDIIFVDHMMPDMDGIETLKHLREECRLNEKTPVIVLTANAVSGAREKYLAAGFDNYLTKPIDSAKLEKMICRYLPENLVEYDFAPEERAEDLKSSEEEELEKLQEEIKNQYEALKNLPMIDTAAGVKATGNIETYVNVVKDFYNTAEGRIDQISSYFEALDYRNYTIQVHALKSSSRLAGDLKLSENAEHLEAMGNAENEAEIMEKTPSLLNDYRELMESLEPVFDSDSDKTEIPSDLLNEALCSIIEVVGVYDFDSADMIMGQLADYRMPADFAPVYRKLKGLIAEVERDGIIELLKKYNQ